MIMRMHVAAAMRQFDDAAWTAPPTPWHTSATFVVIHKLTFVYLAMVTTRKACNVGASWGCHVAASAS
jgi:hypothetical protein